ncbi:MAG: transcriptional regulator, partial [Pelagibacterales bacterium]|nr:transcriptional regulator [Pelagibacterales bacterium]
MKVYYNYLPKQFSNTTEIFKDWKKLISSSEFTLGSFMRDFEKKFAQYIGVKHCIATNTGTDALIIALKSLGVKKNDEVITV